MESIIANDFEKKLNILINNQPYAILEVHFTSPTARGASTMVKARLRHLLNGSVQDFTFKTNEKFTVADVEKVPASFLYATGEDYHFMDNSTYEQFALRKEALGEQHYYLTEGLDLQALKFNGVVVSLELPATVVLKVTETEPPIKGASASGRSGKKATLETGLEVLVALYIEPGTAVQVNTQTGEVSGRA